MLPQRRYLTFYFISSGVVAICILLVQFLFSSNRDEKQVIALTSTEKQFTNCEKLARHLIELEKTPLTHAKFKEYQHRIDSLGQVWNQAHLLLRDSNDSMLKSAVQTSISSAFKKIQPSFTSIILSLEQIKNIQQVHTDTAAQKKVLTFHIQNILKQQEEYLSYIDEISFWLKKEMKVQQETTQRNTIILTSISLAVLLVVSVFIFLPLSKTLSKQNKEVLLKDEELNNLKAELEEKNKELILVKEELKSTQEELERKKLELAGILHTINFSLLYAEYDLDGHLLDANDAYINALNLKPNEYYDKKHDDLVDKDWAQSHQLSKIWKKLVKGVSFGGEICYQLSEEKSAWLYATFTPVKSTKGNFYKIIVLANDITSIKNELHDYRTYTKLLEENKLFAVFDLDTNFVDANDLFIQHFGYAREELLTLKHEAILPEKESIATQQEAFWQNIIQKGSSQKKCFERISSKGKSVWIDGQYVLTMNHKNKPNKIVLIGEVVFLGEIPAS